MSICPACGEEFDPGNEPDPCLGKLPGVLEACCGHGQMHKAYVMWKNGLLFRIRRIERHDPNRRKRRESQA